ncbi:MAG: TonB-dependent receptor [Balneolales bacterium]|nr:TonB-dependent receptor [Balneolales bacterium]
MKAISIIILLCTIYGGAGLQAQPSETQTVSGVVLDKTTKETLPGANVILMHYEPLLGTATNLDGEFSLRNVPIGRHSFKVTYLGYNPKIVSEILVTTGKEVILTIELEEQTFEGEQIEVFASIPKDEAINEMATISAKAFTVEETQRYAGGLDDPGRLVTAFAGVTSSGGVSTNAISIRGNAPKSVQWRLEGIEIPNPSHFAGLSVAGGGGLSLFSSQLLANSDFMTGAFPGEYGNALSGIFDINFRTGNPNEYEHAAQLGVYGLEASSGGPIKRGDGATYLFNYRYSTLTLLMPLLPTEGFISYQDLSLNIDVPTRNAGRFNLWGIGGLDNQTLDAKSDTSKWEYSYWDFSNNEIKLGVGAIGLSHSWLVNQNGYMKTTVALSGNNTDYFEDVLDTDMTANPNVRINNKTSRFAVKSFLNQKVSRQFTLRTGGEYQQLFYNLDLDGRPDNQSSIRDIVEGEGNTGLLQFYVTSKFDITPELTMIGGTHQQMFLLTDEFLIEPRLSFQYKLNDRSELKLGYGKHSQIEELRVYFINDGGEYVNDDLEMTKAHHLVAGWSGYIGQSHHMNVEVFAQRLFDVPVIADSSFSMLNFMQDFTLNDDLINDGEGENYGIELSLERFLKNGYYYLLNTTVYRSRYKGGDNIWRNSRFDQGIAANALYGREFLLKGGRNVLGINGRISVTGGERHSPVDEESSALYEEVRFDESRAYEDQFDMNFIADLSLTYKTNHTNYSTSWALQIKNLLLSEDHSFEYNFLTNRVDQVNEGTILPFLSWKIEF